MGLWAPTEATNAIYWLGSFLRIENQFFGKAAQTSHGTSPKVVDKTTLMTTLFTKLPHIPLVASEAKM